MKDNRLLLVAILGCVAATPAVAQRASTEKNELEEVVVTATRTGAQSVQQTPLAVSAFSANQMEQSQITNIKDLVQYTPNLQVAQATASPEIFIRGIGTTNVFAGSDPDVTVQVDGVYLARPVAQFADFLDVERVEVLRGPQGTLYGRNAIGGTMNVISRQPTDEFAAKALVALGDYNLVQSQAYISGPLIRNRIQASLSANYIRHDGYIDNIAPGGHDVDDANRSAVRGQVRMEITDRINATIRGDWNGVDEHFESYSSLLAPARAAAVLANSIVGDFSKVALDLNQETKNHGLGVSEEVNVEMTGALALKSVTAYRESHYHLTNDSDATELNDAINFMREDEHQFSEELTVQGRFDQLEAVAGLYYLNEGIRTDINSTSNSTSGPPTVTFRASRPLVHSDAKAVFAQGTYKFTSAFHLTLGARYTKENKDIAPNSFTQVNGTLNPPTPYTVHASADFSAFTPKVGLEFQASDAALFYVSATRGYKSGGFNYNPRNTAANLPFSPETIWSYEAGAKTEWLDKRLRANLTAFYYDYTGLQVQAFISPGNAFITNADSATVKGVELELMAKPIANLTVIWNASWLDAIYGPLLSSVPAGVVSRLTGDPRLIPLGGTPASFSYNAKGNYLTAAPRFSSLLAVQYEQHLAAEKVLYGRVEYSWQSRSYFDPTNIEILSQASYGLVNVGVGYRIGSAWNVRLLGKNVLDKQYAITAAALGPITAHAGPPRSIALSASRAW